MKNNTLDTAMTKAEIVAGLCYLPFYLVLWAMILPVVFRWLGLDRTLISINLCYFYLNFIAIVVIFHRTLAASFRNIGRNFWLFLQAVVLGFALYYAGSILVNILLDWLAPSMVNPNDAAVDSMAQTNFRAMLVCSVLLGPMVEETLVRGLVFGNLRRYSRVAAYVVSVAGFAAMHLWQYVSVSPALTLLLSALQYVPGGIALAWTYEKSGKLWGPIVLHVVLNGISMGVVQALG